MNFQNLLDYCKWKDIDVFKGCTVPGPFDIELVKSNIMKRCGLLRPIYSEPLVFQALCKMWFDSNQWNFEHLAKIVEADYSPIENVYESDHQKTEHSGTDERVLGGTDTETLSGTDTESLSGTDTVTDGSASEHTVAGYNSGNYSPSSKDQNSGDIDTKYGKKTDFDYGKKTDFDYGKTDDFTHGHIEEYTRLRHGNIGVTTNNQLITEEYEMLDKFNAYDWIAAKFERENFLQLY